MLHILHTNDFHDSLSQAATDRLAAKKREIGPVSLLLDAGDAGGSGNLTFRVGGEPILERMSALGYDAMTVGNRDFHLTRAGFRCKLVSAAFPILCANVFASPMPSEEQRRSDEAAEEQDASLPVHRYIVREVAAWRIVILGLTVPMITERMLSRKVSAYVFESPLHCAQRLVPRLRDRYQPDLFIALTHIGFAHDRELAAAVPGIDLIVGGHSHTLLPEGERCGQTLIVQAGSRGSHMGIVEIEKSGPSQTRATGPITLRATLEAL